MKSLLLALAIIAFLPLHHGFSQWKWNAAGTQLPDSALPLTVGSVTIDASGNAAISGALTTSGTLTFGTAGTAFSLSRSGTVALTSGSAVVTDTNVASTARFSLMGSGTTAAGILCLGTVNSGTNFAIISTNASDARTVHWRYTQ